MNFRIFFLFFMLSMSDLSHALYGARTVADTRLDGVVSLIFDDVDNETYKGQFCNGVMISPTTVLTAAHCIEGVGREAFLSEDPYSLVMYPGLVVIKAKNKSVKAKKIIFAPSYFEGYGKEGEDLALIELEKPLTGLKPFKLAPKSLIQAGRSVSLVANEKIGKTTLKEVSEYDTATVLRTDGKDVGVCLGDSGGAMLVEEKGEFFLAGILTVEVDGCERRDTFAYGPQLHK